MPGILPMKVIKVGSSAQARIAQACDRCRSKKIRCDGIRPCCSQCSNVGFECKTSDKLSRRAFPRGYTESLEERVRSLESEVRDLKALLDEKDEKIDMLTRLHPQNGTSHLPSPRTSSASPISPSDKSLSPRAGPEETFKVQQSPYLTKDGTANTYFSGTSSGKTFLDSFKQKVQERGKSTADIDAEQLLSTSRQNQKAIDATSGLSESRAPPRLLSDQLVNIFFQEWAPLFPVLHRPTFLTMYEEYTSAPEEMSDNAKVAQVNLVFALAALSQASPPAAELASIHAQWQAALATIQTDQSMPTLQCLLLAQLCCIQCGDYNKLLTYKALAISLSSRLGLHQSQKRFALGTLTCETRKKVFWTLYTIDSFSAVLLGLPQQIKDDDVHCEFPVDADDENVTERGFQAALPGESTRLSSALALFRASRILSKVLTEVYPALPSYELSLQKLSALSEELDQWSSSLASHLKLPFAQDKPSVGTVSSRSPLLSLTYHYIRSLIHRPAVCASLGSRSQSSLIAMAGSCKHIVQVIELLTERGLTFSFCLNKEELLVLSGFGLLYQGLDLEDGSKLLKDNQKTLAIVMAQLDKTKAVSAADFRKVVCSFLPIPIQKTAPKAVASSRHNSEGSMPAPHASTIPPALRQHFKAMTSKFASPSSRSSPLSINNNNRRATEPMIMPYIHGGPAQSLPNLSPYNPSHTAHSEPSRSPHTLFLNPTPTPHQSIRPPPPKRHPSTSNSRLTNLDYLSFSTESTPPPSISGPTSHPIKPEPSDWERLLGTLDNGQTNIFDNIYGGPPMEMLKETTVRRAAHQHTASPSLYDSGLHGWDNDIWTLGTGDMAATTALSAPTVSESVVSFSTDDGVDGSLGKDEVDAYRGIVMPELGIDDGDLLNGHWDDAFVVGV